jgi:predicted exporter
MDGEKKWPDVARRFQRLMLLLRIALALTGASACAFAVLGILLPQRRVIFILLLLVSLAVLCVLFQFRKAGEDARNEFGDKLETFD